MNITFSLIFLLTATLKIYAASMPGPGGGACTMNYAPVCGANGQTYSNACMAQNSGVSFRNGECQTQNSPQMPQDCIHCGPNPMRGVSPFPFWTHQMPMPFMYQGAMPWWGYHGQQRYPNFHYPGVWSGYGMNPTVYPGQGGAFAAKPNVYLDFDKEEQVRVDLTFTKHSSHLVSSPDLNLGWEVVYNDKRTLLHENGQYEYLFYDFRFDEHKAQYTKGFCTDAKNLVPEMMKTLAALKFSEDEIEDFREHWTIKIPFANKYCVYPQFNKELDDIVGFSAYVKTEEMWIKQEVERVLFIIHLSDEQSAFPPAPIRPYLVQQRKDAKKIREWGVAFLAQQNHLDRDIKNEQ